MAVKVCGQVSPDSLNSCKTCSAAAGAPQLHLLRHASLPGADGKQDPGRLPALSTPTGGGARARPQGWGAWGCGAGGHGRRIGPRRGRGAGHARGAAGLAAGAEQPEDGQRGAGSAADLPCQLAGPASADAPGDWRFGDVSNRFFPHKLKVVRCIACWGLVALCAWLAGRSRAWTLKESWEFIGPSCELAGPVAANAPGLSRLGAVVHGGQGTAVPGHC